MTVKLTFLGHSACLIESGTHRVAIDPFLTGNPTASMKRDELKPTHIALTHGHDDHMGDAPIVARDTGATVYAAFELCELLTSQYKVKNVEPGNPGGKIATDFGYIAFTQAFHSSSYNKIYCGMPCGIVVHIDGRTVYHAGDTALFGDMALIGDIYRPDVALLPAGDRFTMGPELAARAAELIQPRVAIPVHHSTWPLLTSDLSAFTPKDVETRVLKPGESIEF
jgi:L-ascorbate metabolism protein UlaG (beta-lactamase superfamily)